MRPPAQELTNADYDLINRMLTVTDNTIQTQIRVAANAMRVLYGLEVPAIVDRLQSIDFNPTITTTPAFQGGTYTERPAYQQFQLVDGPLWVNQNEVRNFLAQCAKMTDAEYARYFDDTFEMDLPHDCSSPMHPDYKLDQLSTAKWRQNHNRLNDKDDLFKNVLDAMRGDKKFSFRLFTKNKMRTIWNNNAYIGCKRAIWLNCLIRWNFSCLEFSQDPETVQTLLLCGTKWDLAGTLKATPVYFSQWTDDRFTHLRVMMPSDLVRNGDFCLTAEAADKVATGQKLWTYKVQPDRYSSSSSSSTIYQAQMDGQSSSSSSSGGPQKTVIAEDVPLKKFDPNFSYESIEVITISEVTEVINLDAVEKKQGLKDPEEKQLIKPATPKPETWYQKLGGRFTGMFEEAKNFFANLRKIPEKANEFLDRILTPFKSLEKFKETFLTFWNQYTTALSESVDLFKVFMMCLGLTFVLIMVCVFKTVLFDGVVFLVETFLNFFSDHNYNRLSDYIDLQFKELKDRFVAQTNTDDEPKSREERFCFLRLIAKVGSYIMSYSYNIPYQAIHRTFDKFKEACKSAVIIERGVSSAKKLGEIIGSFFTWMYDTVHLWYYGYPSSINDAAIVGLIRGAVDCISRPDDTTVNIMFTYLTALENNFKSAKIDLDSRNFLAALMTSLRGAIDAKVAREFTVRTGRAPTFTVLFSGPTDKGKSTFAVNLGKALANAIMGFECPGAFYQKNSSDPWWDGIGNPAVVLIDDFGQSKDFTGNTESEWLQFIKLKNPAAYILPIADAQNKGKSLYNALITLITTNATAFDEKNILSIIHPDAVKRRFDFMVDVTAYGVFNVKKINGVDVNILDLDTESLVPLILKAYQAYYAKELAVNNKVYNQVVSAISRTGFPGDFLQGEVLKCFLEMRTLRQRDFSSRSFGDLYQICSYLMPTVDGGTVKMVKFTELVGNEHDKQTVENLYPDITWDPKILPYLPANIPRDLTNEDVRRSILEYIVNSFHNEKMPQAVRFSYKPKTCNDEELARMKEQSLAADQAVRDYIKQLDDVTDSDTIEILDREGKEEEVDEDEYFTAEFADEPIAVEIVPDDGLVYNADYGTINFEHKDVDLDIADLVGRPPTFLDKFFKKLHEIKRKHKCFVCGMYCRKVHYKLDKMVESYDPRSEIPPSPICWFHEIEKLQLSPNVVNMLFINNKFAADCYVEVPSVKEGERRYRFQFPRDVDYRNRYANRDIRLEYSPDLIKINRYHAYLKLKSKKRISDLTECVRTKIAPAIPWLKTLGLIVATAVGLTTLIVFCKTAYEATKAAKTVEAQTSNGPKTWQKNKTAVPKQQRVVTETITYAQSNVPEREHLLAQVAFDTEGRQDTVLKDLLRVVMRGMCYLSVGGKNYNNAFWVNINTFCIPKHTFNMLKKDDELSFQWPIPFETTYSGYRIRLSECEVVPQMSLSGLSPTDCVWIRVPTHGAPNGMRDLTDKFMSADEINRSNGQSIMILTVEQVDGSFYMSMRTVPDTHIYRHHKAYELEVNKTVVRYEIPEYIFYRWGGSAGACMSIILAIRPLVNAGPRILGFHIAGNVGTNEGFGVLVSHESIRETMSKFKSRPLKFIAQCSQGFIGPVFVVDNENNYTLESIGSKPFEADLAYEGGSDYTHRPTKSKVRTSAIGNRGNIELKKAPAHLTNFINPDGVLIKPVEIALQKFVHPPSNLEHKIVAMAKEDLASLIRALPVKEKPRLLTYDECAFGCEAPYIPPLDRSTSGGHAAKKHFPGLKGKTLLLDPINRVIHPWLMSEILRLEEGFKKGEIPETFVEDMGKDEKREKVKAEAGKMRLFNTCDVAMTILMRRYFGFFMAFIMANRIESESAVGINPTSYEWEKLSLFLKRHGDQFICGDYSNFDGSVIRGLGYAYLDIICEWYDNDVEDFVRSNLFFTTTSPLHTIEHVLYWVFFQNTSGNAITVFLNNGENQLAVRYCWYKLLIEGGYDPTEFAFSDYVSLAVYGDDNIMGVSVAFRHIFNPSNLARSMASIGLTYTDEMKTNDITEFRHLSECSFLKRSFYYDENLCMHLGRLDLDTIMEIPCWTWEDISHDELSMSVEQAIRELALYDAETYEKNKRLILREAKACHYPFIRVSGRDMLRDQLLAVPEQYNTDYVL